MVESDFVAPTRWLSVRNWSKWLHKCWMLQIPDLLGDGWITLAVWRHLYVASCQNSSALSQVRKAIRRRFVRKKGAARLEKWRVCVRLLVLTALWAVALQDCGCGLTGTSSCTTPVWINWPFPLVSSSRPLRCCRTLSIGTSSAPSNSPPMQSPRTPATRAPLNRDKDAGPPAAIALTAVIAIHSPGRKLSLARGRNVLNPRSLTAVI